MVKKLTKNKMRRNLSSRGGAQGTKNPYMNVNNRIKRARNPASLPSSKKSRSNNRINLSDFNPDKNIIDCEVAVITDPGADADAHREAFLVGRSPLQPRGLACD